MFFEMFSQYKHVLVANKTPTLLTCNPEQVYDAILEFSKNNDLFQNCQTYSHQILEISRNILDMVSVRLQI